jgi:hypothetical protein
LAVIFEDCRFGEGIYADSGGTSLAEAGGGILGESAAFVAAGEGSGSEGSDDTDDRADDNQFEQGKARVFRPRKPFMLKWPHVLADTERCFTPRKFSWFNP